MDGLIMWSGWIVAAGEAPFLISYYKDNKALKGEVRSLRITVSDQGKRITTMEETIKDVVDRLENPQ